MSIPVNDFRKVTRGLATALVLWIFVAGAQAQQKQEFSYSVGPEVVISITNNCGPITVKPSAKRQVIVTIISHSDKATFVNEQHARRIELRADSTAAGMGQVEYNVLVPADAFVTMRSTSGPLRVDGLRGDMVLETNSATVEVTNISDAHVHIRTLSGPITLSDIHNSRLDVHSVNGDINIHDVTGPSVAAVSEQGHVSYDGNPGPGGDYLLSSRTGSLDVSIPATAPVQISTHEVKDAGPVISNLLPPAQGPPGSQGFKSGLASVSRFVIRTFSGKIFLKRP